MSPENYSELNSIKQVYVVEDEPPVRILISRLLEKSSYKVTAFEAAEVFLDHIIKAKVKPDLIILDVTLPEMSGIEALYKIKEYPATANISVIMLTANQDPEVIKEAYLAGASDYLLKPILPDLLIDRVKGNLTLNLQIEEIYTIIQRLHLEDPNLLTANGLKEHAKGMRCYPILHNSIQICFLIPNEFRPKAFATSTPEVLRSRVMVYRRQSVRWSQIWPQRVSLAKDGKEIGNETEYKKSTVQAADNDDSFLILSLSPIMTKEPPELKTIRYGKIPNTSVTLWKSLFKWADDKEKCQKEIQFWKDKIKELIHKVGGIWE